MKENFKCFIFLILIVSSFLVESKRNSLSKSFQKLNNAHKNKAISHFIQEIDSTLKFSNNNIFCLSITKTTLNKVVETENNKFSIEWLIKICNECPKWNIYNITLQDSLQLKNMIPINFTTFVSSISASLTPLNTLASTNFAIFPYSEWNTQVYSGTNCPVGYDICLNTTSSMIDPSISFLPAYNTTGNCDCQCTDMSCADFNLKIEFLLLNPDCLSLSTDFNNCIYSSGKAQDTINPYGPPLDLSTILGRRKDPLQELPTVCANGCTEDLIHFNNTPNISPITLKPIMFCNPADNICDGYCPLTVDCGNKRYNCEWILEKPPASQYQYPLFHFDILIPFTVSSLPPQCNITNIFSNQSTLVSCDVLGIPDPQLPIILQGSICLNSSNTQCLQYDFSTPCLSTDPINSPCSIKASDIIFSDISTISCNTITILQAKSSVVVPISNFQFIKKTSNVSTVICNDNENSTAIEFEIDITPFSCSSQPPIGITYLLMDTTTNIKYISNLQVSIITGADCNILPSGIGISCSFIYSLEPIKITYIGYVDCTQCNSFTELCSPPSVTNEVVITGLTDIPCPINSPFVLTLPFQCPCTSCDCTGIIDNLQFNAVAGAYVYARTSTSLNEKLGENLVNCKLINLDNKDYTGFYTWSGGQWIGYPIPSAIIPTNRHAIEIPIDGNYTIQCCAYQQGPLSPRINSTSFIQFTYDHEGDPITPHYTLTFSCISSTIVPSSNPAYIPYFKKFIS